MKLINKLHLTGVILSLGLMGCATEPSPLMMSKTSQEYWDNGTHRQEDGSHIHDQYVVKAFGLREIIDATTWPNGKKDKLRICMIGDDDFRGRLRKMASLVREETGQEWEIKRGIGHSDVKYCDVLFAGFMYSRWDLHGYLTQASGKPILTVGMISILSMKVV